jgi:hypothetical protein
MQSVRAISARHAAVSSVRLIHPIRSFSLKIDADHQHSKPIVDPNTIHPNERRDPAGVQAEIAKLREELKRREHARKNKGSSLQMLGIGAFALNEILGGVVVFGMFIVGGIYIFDAKSFQQAKDKFTSRMYSKSTPVTDSSVTQPQTNNTTPVIPAQEDKQ